MLNHQEHFHVFSKKLLIIKQKFWFYGDHVSPVPLDPWRIPKIISGILLLKIIIYISLITMCCWRYSNLEPLEIVFKINTLNIKYNMINIIYSNYNVLLTEFKSWTSRNSSEKKLYKYLTIIWCWWDSNLEPGNSLDIKYRIFF